MMLLARDTGDRWGLSLGCSFLRRSVVSSARWYRPRVGIVCSLLSGDVDGKEKIEKTPTTNLQRKNTPHNTPNQIKSSRYWSATPGSSFWELEQL